MIQQLHLANDDDSHKFLKLQNMLALKVQYLVMHILKGKMSFRNLPTSKVTENKNFHIQNLSGAKFFRE